MTRKELAVNKYNLLKLAFEYGLNEVHFGLLKLIEKSQIVHWDSEEYLKMRKLSGQPAVSLRKLVDMGLLCGPARGEPINSKPFELSEQGRSVIEKIERGLHKPEWLSEYRVKTLQVLDRANGVAWSVLKAEGIQKITLLSLDRAGYVVWRDPFTEITELGREALREWSQWRLEYEQLQSIREMV
jgi:hypothetical protein